MDPKQSHLRRKRLAKRAAAAIFASLIAAGLACSRTSDVNVAPLQTVVASTLTAVASAASPTASSTPAPVSTAEPTMAPTVGLPTEVPSATTIPTLPPATSAATDDGSNVPGVVSGALSYPGEGIPQLAIVFFNQGNGTWWWVGTAANQASYQMTLPVGTYHVVAYNGSGLSGGYTAAVPCGLTAGCTDHSLLDVQVTSNARVTGINVTDWYAPNGTYPAKPAGVTYP
ncbi:MAG: hypothetical protein WBR18_09015 [Anaerolineales bacterium]